jgi:hypothetical protein
MFAKNKIDMLMNLSLSSAASQMKYAMCYEDFDINEDYSCDVKIIGYNSKKFDVNVFVNYINSQKIKIKKVLGSTTKYKLMVISHDDYPDFDLHFIDLCSFLSGGSLDENSRTFAKDHVSTKGYFPYEFLTVQNHFEELSKTELFAYEDFFSSLNSSNISEFDYKTYCEEAKKCKTRLDYLLFYNEQDTKIMLPIIDNLVNMFAENKIDMLMNLSLSSAASQMKYAMCYEDLILMKITLLLTKKLRLN